MDTISPDLGSVSILVFVPKAYPKYFNIICGSINSFLAIPYKFNNSILSLIPLPIFLYLNNGI